MNIQKLFNIINSIENQLELSNFKINGIDMWPHIRVVIMSRSLSINNDANIQHNYFQRIINHIFIYPLGFVRYLRVYFGDYGKNDFMNSARNNLFLTSSNARRVKYNNKWYDVFCDPLIDEIEKKGETYFVLERSSEMIFKYPRYRKSRIIQFDNVKLFFISMMKSSSLKLDNKFKKEFAKLETLLKVKGFKKEIIKLSTIKKDASYLLALSNYFYNYLVKQKPLKVYTETWYGYMGMALCYACNKKNIPIYDIQHGVQGEYHYAYGSWCNIPSIGYNTQPSNYLNWSKEDSDNINQWLKNSKLPQTAEFKGNPILEKFLIDTSFSVYFDDMFNEKYNKFKHYKKILVTMQNEKSCPEYILELLKKSPSDILWLIRFHPGTDLKTTRKVNSQLKKTNNDNYESSFATEVPVYALLRNVDLHITKSSSVVIEASNFNVKSIVVSITGQMYYSSYIKNNFVFYASEISNIFSVIKHLLK